MKKTRNSYQ